MDREGFRWTPPLPAYRCEGCGRAATTRARRRPGLVRRVLRRPGRWRAACPLCLDVLLRPAGK